MVRGGDGLSNAQAKSGSAVSSGPARVDVVKPGPSSETSSRRVDPVRRTVNQMLLESGVWNSALFSRFATTCRNRRRRDAVRPRQAEVIRFIFLTRQLATVPVLGVRPARH